jgi:predicted MFS family arabinose efflux permease
MDPRQTSPTVLLILLCAAVFLPSVVVLMRGPLLVALAYEFQTSVAIVGQLASATAITWGITAPHKMWRVRPVGARVRTYTWHRRAGDFTRRGRYRMHTVEA